MKLLPLNYNVSDTLQTRQKEKRAEAPCGLKKKKILRTAAEKRSRDPMKYNILLRCFPKPNMMSLVIVKRCGRRL